jgi:hypothetical protein
MFSSLPMAGRVGANMDDETGAMNVNAETFWID